MPRKEITNFSGCQAGIEEIKHPETGELVGRAIVIIDSEEDHIYRMGLSLDTAKELGDQLRGYKAVGANNGSGLEVIEGGAAHAISKASKKTPGRSS